MKKTRTVDLDDILDKAAIEETIQDKLLQDLPKNKPFTVSILADYYNVTWWQIYASLNDLINKGVVEKSKGKSPNRNNITIYKRIK